MRLTVDRDRCCGSGNCALTLPEVFDQDDADGLVVLLQPVPPADAAELLRRAVDRCPTGAIRLTEPPA